MTHADDELLSALIDGEPVEEAAAHVAECAECQARLARLQAVATALKTRVELPAAHVREAAVASAMSAASDKAVATDSSRLLAMSAHATARPAPRRRGSLLSAAAALLVALSIGGVVLSQIGNKGSDDTAATALGDTPSAGEANSKAGGDSADSTESQDMTMAAPASDVPTYAAGDIGVFTSIDQVAKLASDQLRAPDAEQHITTGVEPLCPVAEGQTIVWQATLTWLNEPAVATVFAGASPQWVLEIRTPAQRDCGLLASQSFEPTTQS